MKRIAGAVMVAIAVALALSGPADAAGKLTKQKFVVTFDGEHGQDWKASWEDDETEPVCLYGTGAYGSSHLGVATTDPQTTTFYVNRKNGVAIGSAPVNAILAREFNRGGLPPEDCRDHGYFDTPFNCDAAAVWASTNKLQGATVDVQYSGGRLRVGVTRKDKDAVIEHAWGERCPSAGFDEGKIVGNKKLSKKKLFSGEPVKLHYFARHDYPAPAHHDVEGFFEWKLTIRAVKKG
jgi:hypothetical protein